MHCWYATSYRCWTSLAEKPALLAPIADPNRSPPPAPAAAPSAGLPAAAPRAAPAAAPKTVPIAALVTPLWLAACPGDVPVCTEAHCRHATSSAWNSSKVFPPPGSTITLGPVGTLAHAPTNSGTATSKPISRLDMSSILAVWDVPQCVGGCGETGCQPPGQSWTYG